MEMVKPTSKTSTTSTSSGAQAPTSTTSINSGAQAPGNIPDKNIPDDNEDIETEEEYMSSLSIPKNANYLCIDIL